MFRRVFFFGVAAIATLACASKSNPPVSDGVAKPGDITTGPVTFRDAGGSPSCTVLSDAGTDGSVSSVDASTPCGCFDFPFDGATPNIYFVLDRSGSMKDNGKYDTVRHVTRTVISQLGRRAKFGAALFPSSAGQTGCEAGKEVMSTRLGDMPGQDVGPTATAFVNATNAAVGGGTPTAATMRALLPGIKALSGKTYVVLATDGGPNCNDSAVCDYDTCQLNIESSSLTSGQQCSPTEPPNCCTLVNDMSYCLDSTALISSIKAYADAGILVYVVGIPGSAPYESLLNAAAIAGGTARTAPTGPKYYKVDSTDDDAFMVAMRAIAAQVTGTCEFHLSDAVTDPGLVNVYLDNQVLPQDPTNGWKLENGVVTLLGTACTNVKNGNTLSVRVIAGCPTVRPN